MGTQNLQISLSPDYTMPEAVSLLSRAQTWDLYFVFAPIKNSCNEPTKG